MAIEVTIPRLGWSMDEGTLSEWLKKDGEWVNKGDMLFVLESEKAAQEIESFDEGLLHIPADGAKVGDTVRVGQVIGYLLARGEERPSPDLSPTGNLAGEQNNAGSSKASKLAREESAVDATHAAGVTTKHRTTTPRARRIAKDLNVELDKISGSGRGGRIRERDVRAASTSQPDGARTRKQSLRKTIAARMMASFHGTAPVTLTTRADASNLEVLRKKYKADSGDRVPTITDLLIKLTAIALQQHPHMNARWQDESCVEVSEFNIGLAVDTDAGLMVPVLRDVSRLDIHQVARRSRELAQRARDGQLSLQDMQGGTFTVSNLGMFGIDAFTPIINTPEIAILGIGALRREAVVLENDHIALRDMLTLSLTFDHRAVDGAPAARFLQTLCKVIESAVIT